MTTLVERLEAATGPSRELDSAVYRAAFGPSPLQKQKAMGLDIPADDIPGFTSSIDAALTLAPGEHWEWECSLGGGIATAKLGDPLLHMEGEAATVPLALCIAALKARGVK